MVIIINSIAFTGHRPDKLYGYDLSTYKYQILKNTLFKILEDFIYKRDITTFITGGALGFDTLVFDTVEELKKDYQVQQILAIPFKNQPNKWIKENIDKYNNMKKKAINIYVDEQKGDKDYSIKNTIVGEYHPAKMQKRNEWMVDNSNILIACWNGDTSGGTYNCISYAKKQGKEIYVINPNNLDFYKIA